MVRDRKAFLLHSQFVDTSIFKAVAAIQHIMVSKSNLKSELNSSPCSILYEDQIGDLSIVVKRNTGDGTGKYDSISNEPGLLKGNAQKNLIKGLTADENVVVHVSHNPVFQGYRCIELGVSNTFMSADRCGK